MHMRVGGAAQLPRCRPPVTVSSLTPDLLPLGILGLALVLSLSVFAVAWASDARAGPPPPPPRVGPRASRDRENTTYNII